MRRSIFLCFFLRMRFRRFLTKDPMWTCRVAGAPARPNVTFCGFVPLSDPHKTVPVVRLNPSPLRVQRIDGRGSFNWQDIGFWSRQWRFEPSSPSEQAATKFLYRPSAPKNGTVRRESIFIRASGSSDGACGGPRIAYAIGTTETSSSSLRSTHDPLRNGSVGGT